MRIDVRVLCGVIEVALGSRVEVRVEGGYVGT